MLRIGILAVIISMTWQAAWPQSQNLDRPLVVLDPGHGGIDPGAVRGGNREADLMLLFTRELAEELVRSGRFDVKLTREEDVFLGLDDRSAVARASMAYVFLSFHADALINGNARGAAVYTISREASDASAAALVELHNRAEVLSSQDLTGSEDDVAGILVDLAQAQSRPRSKSLAAHLLADLNAELGALHSDQVQSAGFSVLKLPDIPSALIELGFMSDQNDLQNLISADWRRSAVIAIRNGLIRWYDADLIAQSNG